MQYICLIGCKLPPLDGYVAVCLVLTIEVYDKRVHTFKSNDSIRPVVHGHRGHLGL